MLVFLIVLDRRCDAVEKNGFMHMLNVFTRGVYFFALIIWVEYSLYYFSTEFTCQCSTTILCLIEQPWETRSIQRNKHCERIPQDMLLFFTWVWFSRVAKHLFAPFGSEFLGVHGNIRVRMDKLFLVIAVNLLVLQNLVSTHIFIQPKKVLNGN